MTGRSRQNAPRTALGVLSRASGIKPVGHPPAAVKRLLDESVKAVSAEFAGTEYGRMYLRGELTATQYAACRKWDGLAHDYAKAIGSRGAKSSMVAIDASGGTPPDPDTEAGAKITASERKTVDAYLSARDAIGANSVELRAFQHVVELGIYPEYVDKLRVVTAAKTLATFWKMERA